METNKEPNYVLKMNEAVLMPVEESKWKIILKKIINMLIFTLFIFSFVFQENLFSELSLGSKIIFFSLIIWAISNRTKKIDVPSPIELQFYDEYLVFHQPKRYLTQKVTRKVINKMYYKDITKCVYKTKWTRVQIYGDGYSVWFDYNKDGSIPDKPTREKNFTKGMIYFDTRLAKDVNFVREIEEHAPLKVIRENE